MHNNEDIEEYDRDYYENGIVSGKSLYVNYRWIPELTIPMAMAIIDHLGIRPEHRVIDIGCAKGYLVRALRLLRRQAWGCDVSRYAIAHADPEVCGYVRLVDPGGPVIPFDDFRFDYGIAKDTFEHFERGYLRSALQEMAKSIHRMLVIVPLGEDGRYNVAAYDMDITHKIAEPAEWWVQIFEDHGWSVQEFRYRIPGIKDNWAEYPDGNGFYTIQSKDPSWSGT